MDKRELRQNFLAQRRALSQESWQIMSQAICQNLENFALFQQAKTVLSYFSFRNEPDLGFLFTSEKSCAKNWAVPRCVGQNLVWHRYQVGDRLISGKFGLTEPHDDLPLLDLEKIDLILVPVVACSAAGDRLGYGAGFYDRFLATLTQKVTTIGIVFDCCFVPELPRDPWDMPLNYVCTENQLRITNYELRIDL